jgi:biopolymer transport protein TolR
MGASMGGGGGSRIGQAGGRSRSHRAMSEINVTPFVDVMLVLLVVFMVTAPLLSAGVPIDLPNSEAKPITSEDNKPLEVNITKGGEIYVGESKVDEEKLTGLLTAMTKDDPERRIFIRADTALNYGDVMRVLGILNKAGFRKVALMSQVGSSKK